MYEIQKFYVGKLLVSATHLDEVVPYIEALAQSGESHLVAAPCFRNVMVAEKDPHYAEFMNMATVAVPDGMPLVWFGKLNGFKRIRQTPGPQVFRCLLEHSESGVKHFLLGDTEETLCRIKERFPDALIVGTLSPPFCGIDEFDYAAYAKAINESGAHIVWLSLTAPKQDYFAERLMPLIPGKVVVGVGAAFRYVLGGFKEPSPVIRKMGLTGLVWRKWNWGLVKVYIRAYSCFVGLLVKHLFSNNISFKNNI